MIIKLLKRILAHPLTRGLDIDDPQTTIIRKKIIKEKLFLQQIYREWYGMLIESLPPGDAAVVELGSGAGFLNEMLPNVITSEILYCPGISLVADAQCLPFSNQLLRGILMVDVLHHIVDPRKFFTEASRCLHSGGVIAMIEPWVTPWSRMIYKRLHHEPFLPKAKKWELPEGGGYLSTANIAMPWIIFHRDRNRFAQEFPEWEIHRIKPFMPLRYLLSGGVSMKSLVPSWSFKVWKTLEWPLRHHAGMFAMIVLVKRDKLKD